jgi:pimeloyl-ACP methyl ester carboxylesterase
MVMPGVGILEDAMVPKPDGAFLWHMGFHSVPDVAEMLIRNGLREYMQSFFTMHSAVPDAVDRETLDYYAGLYSEVGALRAFLAYYQNLWVHGEQVKVHMSTPLTMPVVAYGGEASLGPLPRRCMELLATDVSGDVIPNCGHWVTAENPTFVTETLQEFLTERVGTSGERC